MVPFLALPGKSWSQARGDCQKWQELSVFDNFVVKNDKCVQNHHVASCLFSPTSRMSEMAPSGCHFVPFRHS